MRNSLVTLTQQSIVTFSPAVKHYGDVIMGVIATQITSLTIVYSTVYSDADQRKHQSSAWLAFVQGIHRGPVNFPHKWPVTRKMFPFDDVIVEKLQMANTYLHLNVIYSVYYFFWKPGEFLNTLNQRCRIIANDLWCAGTSNRNYNRAPYTNVK